MFADNIKDKSLDEILENNKLFITLKEYKESLKGKCQECTYKMICGGCRATALALKKSLLEEDPLCLLQLLMLQFFAIHINLIGLLPRKELKMKKELMKKEVKNKPVNEVKDEKNNKKKILTCRMCG